MITTLLTMMRGRWVRALAVAAIATATIGVAAAWPAYLARADAAMIGNEIRHATTSEVTMSTRNEVKAAGVTDFAATQAISFRAPWFTTIYATDIDVDTASVAPGGSPKATIPIVLFRQNYCAHVVIVTGRCPVAVREVLLDTGLAARLGLRVGEPLDLYGAVLGPDLWRPTRAFLTVTVVGTYRVSNENDPFWGTEQYFSVASGNRGNVLPILTQPGTVAVLPRSDRRENFDAMVQVGGLTAAALPELRSQVGALRRNPGGSFVSTSIPALLDRIDADRTTLRAVVPAVAVPLVLLGCFALYLMVSQSANERRPEIALIRLRGIATTDRWWLTAAESLVAVGVAIPLGLAIRGPIAALAVAVTVGTSSSVAVAASTDARPIWITVGLVLVAAFAAYARPLAAGVTELLRRIPARARQWRALPAQVVVVVLALAAVVQLRTQTGLPAGLVIIAPALVMAAVAVLFGRVVLPIAGRAGRRAIGSGAARRLTTRRARLAFGLGALALARRTGAQRLLVVEALAIGMLGFMVATSVAAARDRAAFVRVNLGAARVLSVGSQTPAGLLHAVRAADPAARFAMAAMIVPALTASDPPLVAVDTARLGAVANWPRDGEAATAVAALSARGPAPIMASATVVRVDATMLWSSPREIQVNLIGVLEATDGSQEVDANFGLMTPGRHAYLAQVPACAGGCRFVGLIMAPDTDGPAPLSVTVHALTLTNGTGSGSDGRPVTVPIAPSQPWRVLADSSELTPATLSVSPSGLTMWVGAANDYSGGIVMTPVAGPYPLPVAASGGRIPGSLAGLDGSTVRVRVADNAPMLPRVAAHGALVDLSDLSYASIRPGTVLPAEVWLAPNTPPSVVAALSANGLRIVSDRTEGRERAYLAAQGPAVGVSFGVAAAAGLVLFALACLLLVLAVERPERAAELRALRVQGISAAVARRSLLVAYAGLVGVAAIIGLIGATIAWVLTIARLPVFVDTGPTGLDAGALPLRPMLSGAAVGVVALLTVAVWGALAVAARAKGGASPSGMGRRSR